MPTPFPTDWNEYLRTKDLPADPSLEPPVDPMATFQMPTGGISPEQIGRGIEFMYGLQKHREAGRTAAMRWAGMNDFAKMRAELEGQGIASDEAVRRAYAANAHKIHAFDPAGFERAMTVVGRRPPTVTPKASYAENAKAKLLFDKVNFFQAEQLKAEQQLQREGGDEFATKQSKDAAIVARQAAEKAEQAYLEYIQGVDTRLQSPIPRTAMPVPARPAVPAAAAAAAPAATTYSGALPLRGSKAELIKGQRYQTAKGVAVWDGEKFIKQP